MMITKTANSPPRGKGPMSIFVIRSHPVPIALFSVRPLAGARLTPLLAPIDRAVVDIDYRAFPVLVLDDEPDILRSFTINYGEEFHIVTAENGTHGLEVLRAHEAAVIVADQRMPGMSGAEFLEQSIALRPDAIRIMLTGYMDLEALIKAINLGRVYRYVAKPWESEELRLTLRRAIEVYHLTRENARLVEALRRANERLALENAYLREAAPSHQIIGSSEAIRGVLALVARVAPSRSTVLIEGETGTGKELVARAIHAASPRRQKLFVAVNCAALSEGLLESELFGHRRGAFTGAVADRKGLFEVADGGTLFLDEVSETTPVLQGKLLRVLEEGEIRPVGQTQTRTVDVRVVAATNRRLEEEVEAGRFRKDLFYRLRVFPIRLPPLRDRRDDIPELARHFVHALAAQLCKPIGELTPEALRLLAAYPFPGNVRELANEIERAILLADPGEPISEDLLSDRLQDSAASSVAPTNLYSRTAVFEREEIEAALARANLVKARAAEDLGITYRGLLKKMRRLGM